MTRGAGERRSAPKRVRRRRDGAPARQAVDLPHLCRPFDRASNRTGSTAPNLAKGQTGLSIAFDLPTQTGYDSDHPLARGEVGKVGVAISHIGDMRALFDGIPLASMNTSMTINATAPLADGALHRGRRRAGRAARRAAGHDPERHHQGISRRAAPMCSRPTPSLRLTKDLILFCARETPKWNPMNVCSYHLQEAGATPVQELSYALATAIAVLDRVRESGEVDERRLRRRRRRHLVLRQRRHALRHRTRQDARLRRTLGRDRARALRRRPTRPSAASATACRSIRSA